MHISCSFSSKCLCVRRELLTMRLLICCVWPVVFPVYCQFVVVCYYEGYTHLKQHHLKIGYFVRFGPQFLSATPLSLIEIPGFCNDTSEGMFTANKTQHRNSIMSWKAVKCMHRLFFSCVAVKNCATVAKLKTWLKTITRKVKITLTRD